jgi:hypothetical protein
VIPELDRDTGYLPPGVHDATFGEFQARFATNGRRLTLINGLRRVVSQLFAAGVEEVFIGGSFCTKTPLPNDVDGYWVYKKGLDRNKIDPVILNMNAHALDPVSGRFVRAIKLKYGVEFFMDSPNATIDGLTCAEFFGFSRDGKERGIIRVRKEAGI